MASKIPKPWIEVVSLHPDVLSENFSEDIFALDLGPLADGNKNVPAVYRDPEHFFQASYLTAGLRSLLKEVLSRLDGGSGNRVLKLITPFGGGKSHTLAALLHAARNRKALDVIPEGKGMPTPSKVNTAVFDGQFFDVSKGKEIPGEGFRPQTLWGWIAWSLKGKKGYELFKQQDENRVAPGGDEIMSLLGDSPNLILLDEVLEYLISAGGIKVHQTTLRDEVLTFIKHLTVAVGNAPKSVLAFSLQSSKPRESLEYSSLLQTIDHLAARKDQRREPVEKDEIFGVIRRRLLGKAPDADDSLSAATAYQEVVTQMKRAYARSASERQQAEEEGLALHNRIQTAYPFHPALVDLMRERWAAIPEFQRTRGALRFLASCLRSIHREGKSRILLGPTDVPLHDPEVRLAFFKEIGQQVDYQAVLEHDFVGANARVRRIDDRRAKEVPAETGKRPATRLATAILMYSFGGLRREGGASAEQLPPGISEAELLSVCVGPDLDSTTAQACLKELKEQCLYLHYDQVRYCFKKDPNITLLVEQEADAVARDENLTQDKIKEMLESRLAGHSRSAIVWPAKPADIPDKDPSFLVAYMPLEFGTLPKAQKEAQAKEFLEKYGDKPRNYRNGLGLAMPAGDQIETLRRAVRYLIATERVKNKGRQLNLTDEQKSQLREREATERNAAEAALLKLYTEVWLPRAEGGGVGIEQVSVGGRPLQTTLNDKKEAMIHERVMELITTVQQRIFLSLTPAKIIELFKLGTGSTPRQGIRISEVVDGFYSFLGFTRLATVDVISRAVVRGVQESKFGYLGTGVPDFGADGKYQVQPDKVSIGVSIAEDEVDLESGFLMMPKAIPQPLSVPVTSGPIGEIPKEPDTGGDQPPVPETPEAKKEKQKVVDLTFQANRDQLYTAWNAIANLADLAGKVSVDIHAENKQGFDRAKLQNGVIEPLRESDLIE